MGKTNKEKYDNLNIKRFNKDNKNRRKHREVLSKVQKGLIDPEDIDNEDYL